jgi:hypothetical protein
MNIFIFGITVFNQYWGDNSEDIKLISRRADQCTEITID